MEATIIATQLMAAYLGAHIILIPVRVVKYFWKKSARIGYAVFIPVFLIIFLAMFLFSNSDVDYSYFPWGETVPGLLLLLVIAGVAGYLFALVIRVIRKMLGKGMKLSAVTYEASFFLALFVISVISLPMNPETARLRISEAMSLGSAYKTPVAEFYSANHRYPSNTELTTFGQPLQGKFVESIAIDDEGRIIATMKAGLYKSISGKSFILTPHDGGKTWDCGGPEIPVRYLPWACRGH